MADIARPVTAIIDFQGIAINIDQRDLPPGVAEDQLNLTCIELGEVSTRRGMLEVTFEA
jgi:hypothetical protein